MGGGPAQGLMIVKEGRCGECSAECLPAAVLCMVAMHVLFMDCATHAAGLQGSEQHLEAAAGMWMGGRMDTCTSLGFGCHEDNSSGMCGTPGEHLVDKHWTRQEPNLGGAVGVQVPCLGEGPCFPWGQAPWGGKLLLGVDPHWDEGTEGAPGGACMGL